MENVGHNETEDLKKSNYIRTEKEKYKVIKDVSMAGGLG